MDDAAADDDLRESLVALSRLATGKLDLKSTLTQVANFAVMAIPGADGEHQAARLVVPVEPLPVVAGG